MRSRFHASLASAVCFLLLALAPPSLADEAMVPDELRSGETLVKKYLYGEIGHRGVVSKQGDVAEAGPYVVTRIPAKVPNCTIRYAYLVGGAIPAWEDVDCQEGKHLIGQRVVSIKVNRGRLFPIAIGNQVEFEISYEPLSPNKFPGERTDVYSLSVDAIVVPELDFTVPGDIFLIRGTRDFLKTGQVSDQIEILWSDHLQWAVEVSREGASALSRHVTLFAADEAGGALGTWGGTVSGNWPDQSQIARIRESFLTSPQTRSAARYSAGLDREYNQARQQERDERVRRNEQAAMNVLNLMGAILPNMLSGGQAGGRAATGGNMLAPGGTNPGRAGIGAADVDAGQRCNASCSNWSAMCNAPNAQRACYEYAACMCRCMGDEQCYAANKDKARALSSNVR